jgi:hypothetical protein
VVQQPGDRGQRDLGEGRLVALEHKQKNSYV